MAFKYDSTHYLRRADRILHASVTGENGYTSGLKSGASAIVDLSLEKKSHSLTGSVEFD